MHPRDMVGTNRMLMPPEDVGITVKLKCGSVVRLRAFEHAVIDSAGGGPVASWGIENYDPQIVTFHTFVKKDGDPFEHLHLWEQHPTETPNYAKIERPIATGMMPNGNPIANFRLNAFNPTVIRLAYLASYYIELMRDDGNPGAAAKMRYIADHLSDAEVADALQQFETYYKLGDWMDTVGEVPPYWIALHQNLTREPLSAAA